MLGLWINWYTTLTILNVVVAFALTGWGLPKCLLLALCSFLSIEALTSIDASTALIGFIIDDHVEWSLFLMLIVVNLFDVNILTLRFHVPILLLELLVLFFGISVATVGNGGIHTHFMSVIA